MSLSAIERVTYSDNKDLHGKVLEATLSAKTAGPFVPVTLLVDSPLKGTLIRRQIIELSATSAPNALANFKVMTPLDLVSKLASNFTNLSFTEPKTEYLEALIFSLMNQEKIGDDSEQSMATASAVAKVFRQLQFVSDESLELLVSSSSTTSTQKYVFGIIESVRERIDAKSAADVCQELEELITDSNHNFLANQIGTIFNLVTAPANSLVNLLEKLNSYTKVLDFEQQSDKENEPLAGDRTILVSCPDPTLEVSMVTRDLMNSLETVRADRIAILYPDESEYGNQLRDSLDESGVQWHGKGRTYFQSSVLCRGLDLVLEILSERNETFSGLDRPRLMRLIENGFIAIPGVGMDFAKVRRWVRRQELYADCVSWISILDDVAQNEYDPENSVAPELKNFLEIFEAQLATISQSTNWEELGKSIWSFLEFIYGKSDLLVEGSIEEESLRRIGGLLLGELAQLQPLLAGVGAFKFVNEVMNLRNMVRTKIGDRAVSNGNLSTGVMVGEISSAEFLTFDKVYVLGATEGLLPTVTKEDPYLPVKSLELIGEEGLARTSRENSVDNIADILSGATASANSVVVFRPRGGTKTKLENEPSRFLGSELNDKKNLFGSNIFQVQNREHSFSLNLGSGILKPVSRSDHSQLLEKFTPSDHKVFTKSLLEWRNPTLNEHFGHLSIASKEKPIWSPQNSKPLSSTAIDSYMVCRYQFLITNILKFNSSARADTLDDFNPNRFGIYFHKQMENFVNDSKAKGTEPAAGENWPDGAAESFIQNYFLENLYLFENRGQAGWNRSFEFHKAQVIKALPEFFAKEPELLRRNPDLIIYKPEFSFGFDHDEVDLVITDDVDNEKYHIRGAVDRLDVSPDENYAAVMDFKTGDLKKMKAKLQITPSREEKSDNRKTVQDIIYRRVALEKFDKAQNAKVYFVFIPDGEGTSFLWAKFAHDPDNFLINTLRSMKESGITGEYPPAKGGLQGDHAYCTVCKTLGVTPVAAGAGAEGGEESDE